MTAAEHIIPWNTIHIPTGELIIADNLSHVFPIGINENPQTDLNRPEGRIHWVQHYAALGVASAFIGNRYLNVYRQDSTGNLIIGDIRIPSNLQDYNTPQESEDLTLLNLYSGGNPTITTEEDSSTYAWTPDPNEDFSVPPGWTLLGEVETKLWAYMLTDKQTYINAGGTEAALEALGATVVKVTPGTYHFITYVNHPEFDPWSEHTVYAEAILEQ